MAMNFGDSDDDSIMAEINMTPLIDIMLVLLILFMVTSSVSLESGLDLDLPQIKGATQSREGTAVIIGLDNQGKVFVQGQLVDFDNLEKAIFEALRREGSKLVILEGDRKSRLGNAIEIMDIARSAGAESFAIAAEQNQ